jgi:dolichol-phosphate mannosyltransferase
MDYDISIIIPFLNEESNIPKLVKELDYFICDLKAIQIEVIFVDDGSSDNSFNLLCQTLSAVSLHSKIIKLSKNFGSHAALRAGVYKASGKYIVFMYADLKDPLSLIPQLYSVCNKDNDIVWAIRKTVKFKFFEKIFSKWYAKLMKIFVSENYPEKGFDIVMFNKKIQHELNHNIESNSSIFLQILTMGFKQETIEYDKLDRLSGKSKWTIGKKIKLFIDSFVSFSYAPIRFVTIMGISFFIIGICWTIYIVIRTLLVNDYDPGWPGYASILLVGFGLTNISLGIIAEYLWRTMDASKKSPVFIIDKILEINTETINK